ncbi:MAG: protease modulator HflC [Sphingomonadaceae bacterium]
MSEDFPTMREKLMRNPIGLALMALALVVLLVNVVKFVPETKQGVVLLVGKPNRILNGYRPKEPFGNTGAGLAFIIPIFEEVRWIDKRILDVEMQKQQVLSTDQLQLSVDAFARFRITDPLRMVTTAGTEDRVSDQLGPILGSSLRNELGKRTFAAMLTPERDTVMLNIKASLNRIAKQYGAEIIDVRIKRADLPDGTPLDSAYQRMRTAREQEALTIIAQGQKNAQIIRGEAEGTAAQTYAGAFGKDPDFYDFYRAMQSYKTTFGAQAGGQTSVVLSPSNDYLREFRGGR